MITELPDHIQWLMQCTYPHGEQEKQLLQTHISHVILVGGYVYKWKKAVNLGFLDFSTLSKRKHFCEQELMLNRRLCPDIYLKVVRLTMDRYGYQLDGKGEPIEYGVKMARMPGNCMMDELMRMNRLKKTHLDEIVSVLVPFYKSAAGGERINHFGEVEAIAKNVMENFQQTERFAGSDLLSRSIFENVRNYASRRLTDTACFNRRIEGGKIHDCHGDLHSANICLSNKVHIFDCIEFNDRLRYSDVAADIAFLAMDLDFHGLEELSDYFVENFMGRSEDETLREVLTFYKCYRAVVRAKVSLLTLLDKGVDGKSKERSADLAKRYFSLAERYSRNDRGA